MEKGELRCDVNISLRPRGTEAFGARSEIKNLNSFRYAKQAIEYEVERQRKVLESGGRGVTETMRSKEEAHDYRYFPEPDLLPVTVEPAWLEEVRRSLPELPAARRARLMEQGGISEQDTRVLISERGLADFFEALVKAGAPPKLAVNWVVNELLKVINEKGLTPPFAIMIKPEGMRDLLAMLERKTVTATTAKEVLAEMAATGGDAKQIVEKRGLSQVSDAGEIERWAAAAIAANPKGVDDYKAGKVTAIKFLIGQIMRQSKGRANPAMSEETLRRLLG
jgi:aspartyl-tRNA(Asn)/glutamyl-tRNA(Gln) amidotransferase subunit B